MMKKANTVRLMQTLIKRGTMMSQLITYTPCWGKTFSMCNKQNMSILCNSGLVLAVKTSQLFTNFAQNF